MDKDQNLMFKDFLITFLVLFVAGLIGLIFVIFFTVPTIAPRWLFLFFMLTTITGAALPATYYLNKRFPSNPPVGKNVILRQALWFGIYAALLSWLRIGRVLNFGLAIILAGGAVLIELLLRLWERSYWKPSETQK